MENEGESIDDLFIEWRFGVINPLTFKMKKNAPKVGGWPELTKRLKKEPGKEVNKKLFRLFSIMPLQHASINKSQT
ncbi:hypothetical protein GCM10009133_33700 [Cocleimonas flava]